MSSDSAERLLADLISRLISIQGDLVQFPITYYFHNMDEKFSPPVAVPYLARLAEQADSADHPPQVRMRVAMLADALEDFSTTIGSGFLGMPSAPTAEVLQAYARDHLHGSSFRDGG